MEVDKLLEQSYYSENKLETTKVSDLNSSSLNLINNNYLKTDLKQADDYQ